jgi:flagellar basal-body rod modification protein FlgD
MMTGELQNRINPFTPPTAMDVGTGKIAGKVGTPEGAGQSKIDFLGLMQESGKEVQKDREAKKNGDLSGAKSYEDFLDKLATQNEPRRDPKNVLNKDDFLKLFVTQLQNQDPLNPDDGAEMASKLAQFNGLEQMMNMNKTLESMVSQQNEGKSIELINYIGKEVTVDGGRARLKDGNISDTTFNVKSPAAQATLQVRDGAGVLVHESDLGGLPAGSQTLKWNGLLKDGNKAMDGLYTFSISAKGLNNDEIPVDITSNAKITGVDIKDKDGAVYTNLGLVKFSSIKSVGAQGFGAVALAAANETKKQEEAIKLAAELAKPKEDDGAPASPVKAGAPVVPAVPGAPVSPEKVNPQGLMKIPGTDQAFVLPGSPLAPARSVETPMPPQRQQQAPPQQAQQKPGEQRILAPQQLPQQGQPQQAPNLAAK